MIRTIVLPIAAFLAAIIMIAIVAAQIGMWQFANECEASGGSVHSPSNILGTTWCRY